MRKIFIFSILYFLLTNVFAEQTTTLNQDVKASEILQQQRLHSLQPLDKDNPYLIVPQHLVKRFYFTGSVRVTGFASNHTPTTVGVIPSYAGRSPGATDINLTTAMLTANIELNDWITSVISMAYSQTSPSFIRSPLGGGDTFVVDRAYVKFEKEKCSPLFIKIGRYFVPFGGLDTSNYLSSSTQLLSLNRETLFAVGIDNWYGLHGYLYAFRGLRSVNQNDTHVNSFGILINFENNIDNFNYELGASFLNNITSGLYAKSTVARGSPLDADFFTRPIRGIDLHAAVSWDPFDASIKYVGALNTASVADIPITRDGGKTFRGAKLSGWGINLGYQFTVMCHQTRLGIGYQGSREAVSIGRAPASSPNDIAGPYGNFFAIGIPQLRYFANYNFNIVDRADVAFELDYDKGYSSKYGGTGRSTVIGLLVLTVSK